MTRISKIMVMDASKIKQRIWGKRLSRRSLALVWKRLVIIRLQMHHNHLLRKRKRRKRRSLRSSK